MAMYRKADFNMWGSFAMDELHHWSASQRFGFSRAMKGCAHYAMAAPGRVLQKTSST
jgi:hypothetical protein